jgi:16S rRNA G966 N2-methylase RsmD
VQQFSDIGLAKKRIANDLYKIRHWKIKQGDYRDIPNESATWFIDPPYQNGGHKYTQGNGAIDFHRLAEWCKERQGQVIVCENTKADWLPFWRMKDLNGAYSKTAEAIWCNHETGYEVTQMSLFEAT